MGTAMWHQRAPLHTPLLLCARLILAVTWCLNIQLSLRAPELLERVLTVRWLQCLLLVATTQPALGSFGWLQSLPDAVSTRGALSHVQSELVADSAWPAL